MTNIINEAYRLLYEERQYVTPKDVTRETARTLADECKVLRKEMEAEWNVRVSAEMDRLAPKTKRKRKNPPIIELPKEFYDSLRAELFAKFDYERLEAKVKAVRTAADRLIWEIIDEVEITPDPECWYRVKVSSTYGFSSQTSPGTYAKGSLYPLMDQLHRKGLETNIRYAKNSYELWTNCPPWLADAAEKQTSIVQTLRSLKGRSVNPHVLFPFLPHNLADSVPWGAAALNA